MPRVQPAAGAGEADSQARAPTQREAASRHLGLADVNLTSLILSSRLRGKLSRWQQSPACSTVRGSAPDAVGATYLHKHCWSIPKWQLVRESCVRGPRSAHVLTPTDASSWEDSIQSSAAPSPTRWTTRFPLTFFKIKSPCWEFSNVSHL